MSSNLIIPSMLGVTAGALVLLSFYLYKRKGRDIWGSNDNSKEDIYQPVTEVQSYDIFIIDESNTHHEAVESFAEAAKQIQVIGLDCEWVTRDSERQPVALLQLSSPVNQSCLLFRLNELDGVLPESILKILFDRNILKVGVGVLDDAKRLVKDYQIMTRGCLDLRHLALRHMSRSLRGRSLGLRELASVVLQHDMSKNNLVRRGNWEAIPLSEEQINYAAEDAVIGAAIFLRVVAYKMRLKQFESFFLLETWRIVSSMCQGIVDLQPDVKQLAARNTSPNKPTRNSKVQHKDLEEHQLTKALQTRKSVKYHNCRLLAPDDTLLCTCDKRKALWYISKEIGELVCEEPVLTVKLLFEPSGIPGPDREYYLTDKKNRCVVCGREDSYIKKNIVPHEYRRHFPDYLKKHSSHDVLLLCLRCHHKSSAYDTVIREDLSHRYNAPITNQSTSKSREDPRRLQVRSSARALIRHKKSNNIPEQRVQELIAILEDFYETDEIDEDLLEEANVIELKW